MAPRSENVSIPGAQSDDPAPGRAADRTRGEAQALVGELARLCMCASGPLVGAEQQADGIAHLGVGVAGDPPRGIVNEADGWSCVQ